MNLKNQKGTAVVEFAIVLPMLVLLLFGIIEFSLLFYNKAMITNASREGARAGIVYDQDLVNGVNHPIDSKIETVVDNYLGSNLITFGGGTPSTIITREGDASGNALTITVTYPYDFLVIPGIIVGLFNGSMNPSLTLQAVTLMRME